MVNDNSPSVFADVFPVIIAIGNGLLYTLTELPIVVPLRQADKVETSFWHTWVHMLGTVRFTVAGLCLSRT